MDAIQISGDVQLSPAEFKRLRDWIFSQTGIFLADSKHTLMQSRLARRLRHLQLESYDDYFAFVTQNDPRGEEREQLINCITTNKTDFFRESHHFDFLRNTIFPAIEEQARSGGPRRLRLWSAACSTGEEPYTLAMTVLEHFGAQADRWDIRILATDIDTDVLARAQRGEYEPDRVDTIAPGILSKYFEPTSRGPSRTYQVRESLQRLITFRSLNFMHQPWPLRATFDAIFCRNVIIYFPADVQDLVIQRFVPFLAPRGHLFLGHSESLLRLNHLFAPVGNTIYQLRDGVTTTPASPPSPTIHRKPTPRREAPTSHEQREVASSPPAKRPTPPRAMPEPRQAPPRSRREPPAAATNRTRATLIDGNASLPMHSIIVGDVFASDQPACVRTVLGSCISACLFDPVAQVGGMNHFMLPKGSANPAQRASYGIHAMEMLINEIMKLGGERQRLVAKIFGGAAVIEGMNVHNIGQQNIDFVEQFLQAEGLPVAARHLGGKLGMQVRFLTHSGKALVRTLSLRQSVQAMAVQEVQSRSIEERLTQAAEAAVTLF